MLNQNTHKRSSSDFQVPARSKAKLLQILPDLAEEDEFRSFSNKSAASKPAGTNRPFPFDLTSVGETLFLRSPRRAPRPPVSSFYDDEDDDSVTDLFLDFPSPPGAPRNPTVSLTRSPATKVLPMRFRKPRHSLTSSIGSISTASLSSNSSSQLSTPVTSDDDEIPSSITAVNSKRLSLIFTKLLPDLHRDVIQQFIQSDTPKLELDDSFLTTSEPTLESDEDEEEKDDDDDDRQWVAREMKDFVMLAPPTPNFLGFSNENSVVTRPESFLPPPRTSRRYSSIMYRSTGPSAQLDPTFPFSPREQLPRPPVPDRPLPSPPVNRSSHLTSPSTCSTPPTVSSSVGLLTLPSSTSINLSRPPPKSSIPFDVDELMQMDLRDFDLLEEDLKTGLPDSPFSAYSSYHSSPTSSLGFGPEDPPARIPSTPGHPIPDSPLAKMYSPQSPTHRKTSSASTLSTQNLRSRWSSSSLSSLSYQQSPTSSSSSWIARFSLRHKKCKAPVPPLPSVPTKAVKKEKQRKFIGPDLHLRERDSRSSRTSSDSLESSSSVGLKRKPIPVEIFMKA